MGGFPIELPELQRAQKLQQLIEVFETMARLDHPDAEAMLGKHSEDKQTAKAARRAAYKASTRRTAHR